MTVRQHLDRDQAAQHVVDRPPSRPDRAVNQPVPVPADPRVSTSTSPRPRGGGATPGAGPRFPAPANPPCPCRVWATSPDAYAAGRRCPPARRTQVEALLGVGAAAVVGAAPSCRSLGRPPIGPHCGGLNGLRAQATPNDPLIDQVIHAQVLTPRMSIIAPRSTTPETRRSAPMSSSGSPSTSSRLASYPPAAGPCGPSARRPAPPSRSPKQAPRRAATSSTTPRGGCRCARHERGDGRAGSRTRRPSSVGRPRSGGGQRRQQAVEHPDPGRVRQLQCSMPSTPRRHCLLDGRQSVVVGGDRHAEGVRLLDHRLGRTAGRRASRSDGA